jgi:hypothetical protein
LYQTIRKPGLVVGFFLANGFRNNPCQKMVRDVSLAQGRKPASNDGFLTWTNPRAQQNALPPCKIKERVPPLLDAYAGALVIPEMMRVRPYCWHIRPRSTRLCKLVKPLTRNLFMRGRLYIVAQ